VLRGAQCEAQIVDDVCGTWELGSRIPHVTVHKKSRMLNRLRNELRKRLLRQERKRYSLIAQRSCAGIQRMDGSPGSRHRQGRGAPGADIFEREHRSLAIERCSGEGRLLRPSSGRASLSRFGPTSIGV
jgi:hypothetical protein